jgi:hypothetical protein
MRRTFKLDFSQFVDRIDILFFARSGAFKHLFDLVRPNDTFHLRTEFAREASSGLHIMDVPQRYLLPAFHDKGARRFRVNARIGVCRKRLKSLNRSNGRIFPKVDHSRDSGVPRTPVIY